MQSWWSQNCARLLRTRQNAHSISRILLGAKAFFGHFSCEAYFYVNTRVSKTVIDIYDIYNYVEFKMNSDFLQSVDNDKAVLDSSWLYMSVAFSTVDRVPFLEKLDSSFDIFLVSLTHGLKCILSYQSWYQPSNFSWSYLEKKLLRESQRSLSLSLRPSQPILSYSYFCKENHIKEKGKK